MIQTIQMTEDLIIEALLNDGFEEEEPGEFVKHNVVVIFDNNSIRIVKE